MTTPQNDIKREKSQGEDRLDDAEKRNQTRHTRGKCWKLHGRPTQGRGGGCSRTSKSYAHMTEASEGPSQSYATQPSGFSNKEIHALRRMMVQLESSYTTTTSIFPHSDIPASAFNVHSYNDSQPWILELVSK